MVFIFYFTGSNANSTLIKDTCCGIGDTTPFQVYSTDSFMYVLFRTDISVGNTGFRISYILEGATTTTARTTTSKTTINYFHFLPGHLRNLPDSNRQFKYPTSCKYTKGK